MKNQSRRSFDRDDVQRKVIAIISHETGSPIDNIEPSTDLVYDLGVSGDDADRLLIEITKYYQIDFTGSDLYLRFGSEGYWPWQIPIMLVREVGIFLRKLIFRQSPRKTDKGGVRVDDVVDWIMVGHWAPKE